MGIKKDQFSNVQQIFPTFENLLLNDIKFLRVKIPTNRTRGRYLFLSLPRFLQTKHTHKGILIEFVRVKKKTFLSKINYVNINLKKVHK